MDKVKSLEDLKRLREEALAKRQMKSAAGEVQVIVGMGTVGIAAGARETMKAILDFIQENSLSNVQVRQTGNIGMDSYEPIIQIQVGDSPKVTYGRVGVEAARRIMKEHVVGGQVVKDYAIEG